MHQHRIRIVGLFCAFVLVSGFVGWLNIYKAQSAPQKLDWPGFEMFYKDWHRYSGQEYAPHYRVERLVYTDRLHWRSDILEETSAPDYAGSFMQVSGDTIKSANEKFGTQDERKVDLSEGLYAPDDWLMPIRISKYKQIPGTIIRHTDTPGLMELTYTEQVPCDPETWKCETDTYEVVTSVRYWADSELPMGMTVTSNGELVREITVTDFKWLSSK
jgi:hypothetical protein